MMTWTWRTWPDPLVDFGRELYLAWQLSRGRTLYVDNAYFDGPLSPYLNALWMKLFGVSITSVMVANFIVMIAVIALLHGLLRRAAGRVAALVGALLFVAISCFGRLVPCGNYNFMTPYSHHFTYGFLFSLAAISCTHLPSRLRGRHVAFTGLLVGLVFLTKVEFAFAAALVAVAGLLLRTGSERPDQRLRLALILSCAAASPAVIAFSLLVLRMPPAAALRGTLGSIYWTLASHITSLPFYRAGLGIDDVRGNLLLLATGATFIFLAACVAVGVAFASARITRTRESRIAPVIAFVTVIALLMFTLGSPRWFDAIPKALPLAMAVLTATWLVIYLRSPRETENSQVLALRIALCLYALALLGKMVLNARLYHYGFVLAVPALLLLVAGFVSWLPAAASKRGADGGVVRAVGLACVSVLALIYVGAMIPLIRNQQHPVGSGPNAFLADERGAAEQIMVEWINKNVPAEATLAVVPEGAMINFLTHRANPTPNSIFMPPEMLVFGEDQMLQGFKSAPPDFVLLCHKDTSEFGVPLFGRDYGEKIGNWIRENYTPVVKVGDVPLQDPYRFGILLLRKRKQGF